MTKEILRKQALQQRKELSEVEFRSGSNKIVDHILGLLDLPRIQFLHSFLPMTSRKEPDLWPLLDVFQKKHPSVKIVVPRINGDQLENVLLEKNTQLVSGPLGISEPEGGQTINPQSIDVVLVPVLTADVSGNRLGYGKGFYDRFLSECRPDCLKIGVSILEPVASIPAEPHDIRLNRLVTPLGVMTFG